MTGPVSENGTPWHQLPGATDGVRTKLSARPAYDEASPIGGIFGMLIAAIVRAIAGLLGAGTPWGALNPLNWLAGEMSEKWEKLDNVATAIDTLGASTQVLEGVLGLGQWTRSAPLVVSTNVIHRPNQQVGKMVGCSYNSATGVVTLHSRGLWDIRYREMYGTTRALKFQNNEIASVIEISYDNFATLYARILDGHNPHTSSANVTDEDYYGGSTKPNDYVVMPEPGAQIRVRQNVAPPRRSGGGFANNCLTVKKEDTGLGPGIRLDQSMPLTVAWQKVAPVLGAGGATVTGGNIITPAVSAVRLDTESTGTGPYEMRVVRGGTTLVTSSAPAAEQSLTWHGSVAAGAQVWLEARSDNGAVLNSNNATWLTYFDKNQYNEVP